VATNSVIFLGSNGPNFVHNLLIVRANLLERCSIRSTIQAGEPLIITLSNMASGCMRRHRKSPRKAFRQC